MQRHDYVEGSAKVQIAMILLLMLAVGLFFHLQSVIAQVLADIQLLSGSRPELAIKMAGRLLLWLVMLSGSIAIAISSYLIVLSSRVKKFGLYPPPGMPVAFKTPIKSEAAAARMRQACLFLAVLLFTQPVIGFFLWYRITGGAW
ncbi:hypothetical protein BGP75_24410 [Motiliproteus sp. MSK22-1]|nr:hypothetical protein BGP75_24410 [Motiliproteus sp. MSK22-1]